jgi:NADPH-dependent curcumin reductase CurA
MVGHPRPGHEIEPDSAFGPERCGDRINNYLHLFQQFVDDSTKHYRDGKVVYAEDRSVGLEIGPAAFVGLFSGKNIWKQVVCVSQD